MAPTMRAERFYADTKKVALEDVPIPEPGPGEVLVKVVFCGICHSDLSLINGTFPAQTPVVTQGHEASGTIAKLGPEVTGWAEGDRVVVAAGRPCQTCLNCRRGDVVNCLRIQLMAFAYDGAWAEYTVAQAAGLTRVPDNVPLEQAAILADAVSTPFGAVVRTGKLAFDSRDDGLQDKIAEITGGGKLDAAFDAVGLKVTFEQALDSLTVGGRLVGVGMSAESPTIGPTAMFGLTRKQVLGHLGYQNVDIETLVRLVSAGRLNLSRSISEIVALEDLPLGIEKLERQDGNPIRILVKP
jgi:D-arabinose 1-dehydrogenase-like Zn-dependent alcohol dehydrogenase